jgi:hypothetical protein
MPLHSYFVPYLPSPLLTKEENREGKPIFFFPVVSGRISEEEMRVG